MKNRVMIASRVTRLFAALALIVLFNSCAVMFGGSKYNADITVDNNPNADIYINGMKQGTGKAQVLLPRKDNLNLELRDEDCETQHLTYPNQARVGTEVLSFVSWGFVGLIVDFASGAAFKPDADTRGVTQINTKTFKYQVEYDGCPDEEIIND